MNGGYSGHGPSSDRVHPAPAGVLLSLVGGYVYWWSTGFSSPGILFMAVFTLVGLVTVAADILVSSACAKAGGASNMTVVLAVAVGLVLTVVAGPVGFILGIGATVFAVEFYQGSRKEESMRAALYTMAGVLGSIALQTVVALGMLVSIAVVAVL
ncbi:MAG: DUF456 domain-containing protein [Candidatus Nanohaloarchaea archaeon]|nr:DUF456 domain-containing protein [Candidatus Nanohaloarchaea archaeon]